LCIVLLDESSQLVVSRAEEPGRQAMFANPAIEDIFLAHPKVGWIQSLVGLKELNNYKELLETSSFPILLFQNSSDDQRSVFHLEVAPLSSHLDDICATGLIPAHMPTQICDNVASLHATAAIVPVSLFIYKYSAWQQLTFSQS
jgi:hypothetical protein